MAKVSRICRYPVKGLSPDDLTGVVLAPGETLPHDRAYAIENGPSGFDPNAPKHAPKIAYLMLMRNERLAELRTRFDPATQTLSINRNGSTVVEGRLDTEIGRRAIEAFFDAFSANDLRGPAKVLSAPGYSFSDADRKLVSLINVETTRAIAKTIGADVDPVRFRGNLYVEGMPAWEEFDWIGKRLRIGGVTFSVLSRIDRCAATNVNPTTAHRDLAIPRHLLTQYGHADCGVYLEVVEGGTLTVGDPAVPV